jgi:hypothetical protein
MSNGLLGMSIELQQKIRAIVPTLDNFKSAVKAAILLAQMTDAEVYRAMGMDRALWSMKLSGKRKNGFNHDQIISFQKAVGNNLLTQWLDFQSFPNKYKAGLLECEQSNFESADISKRVDKLENTLDALDQRISEAIDRKFKNLLGG